MDIRESPRNYVDSGEGFGEIAQRLLTAVVAAHERPLPYAATEVTESVLDADARLLAFVLFEQVDRDASNWQGDQFRYSIWVSQEGEAPRQVFEDHAYAKERDCAVDSLHVEGGVVKAVSHSKGTLSFEL
jgi:hypothetical protein